jgi:hypothetical protein
MNMTGTRHPAAAHALPPVMRVLVPVVVGVVTDAPSRIG